MRGLLIFIMLTLLSCTTINNKTVVVEEHIYDYIDSSLDPILQQFEYEARIRGARVDRSHLSMTFGLIRQGKDDRTVGYCGRSAMGGMIIKIHKKSWDGFDESQREELIFHELGHCLAGRDHCGKQHTNGPISIMYPEVLPGDYYKKNREELVDELFNISSECVGDNGSINASNGQVCPPSHPDSKR